MTRKSKPLKDWEDRKIYPLTKIHQKKVGNKWITVEVEKETVSKKHYNNAFGEETIKFFRRLGGKEQVDRRPTWDGYKPVKVISTSPSGDERYIRQVDFDKAYKNSERQRKIYSDAMYRRYKKKNGN